MPRPPSFPLVPLKKRSRGPPRNSGSHVLIQLFQSSGLEFISLYFTFSLSPDRPSFDQPSGGLPESRLELQALDSIAQIGSVS
jgi:hypothetical protein